MSSTTTSPPQTPQVILSPETLKATGLLNLTNEQVKRALFVRNISSRATLKQVSDFFNFCGNVEKIIQDQDPTNEGKQFAVVVFEQDSAYGTALLLGQAVIVDSPITVFPYSKILSVTAPAAATTKTLLESGATAGAASSTSSTTTSSSGNASNDRQATAVIASLIAQGYVRGELLMNEMKVQAKQLDQQAGVSNRVKLAAEISRKKAQDIDNSLHLTQRLNSLKSEAQMGVRIVGQELGKVRNDIQRTFSDIEEKYKIQEKAKQASQATIKTAQDLYNKTMENDAIRNTTSAVSSLLTTGWNSLKSSFTTFQQETQLEIRKQKERTGTSQQLQQQQRPAGSSQQQPISYATLDDDNNVEEDLIEDYEEEQQQHPAPSVVQRAPQQQQDFMAFDEVPQQQQQPPKAPQQEDLFKFD